MSAVPAASSPTADAVDAAPGLPGAGFAASGGAAPNSAPVAPAAAHATRRGRRAVAGTLALAVCLAGGAALAAGPASADATFTFGAAIAGPTRFETAVAAADAAFGTGADAVVLVNGYRPVDGLTASYLAGLKGAPILYTRADSTPSVTSAEIKKLKATKIYFVGGDGVISRGQKDYWSGAGYTVTTYGGASRYDTAAQIAALGGARSTAFIASGDDAHLADALAVGPIAYKSHYPILLTSGRDLTAATRSALTGLKASVVAVGGADVVSDGVMDALHSGVRLSGDDRSATAADVAGWAIENAGFTKATVALVGARNANLADALVAAPVAAAAGAPLLFAGTTATNAYLAAHAADLKGRGLVFGDTDAVPAAAIKAATTAAQGGARQAFTVSGGGGYITGSSDAGNATYTFTGTPGEVLTVALFSAANVTTDSSGSVLLARSGTSAVRGSVTGASLRAVSGAWAGARRVAAPTATPTPVAATPTPMAATATVRTAAASATGSSSPSASTATSTKLTVPESGAVSVVVHHDAVTSGSDAIVPIVYRDTDDDGALDVGTEATGWGRPTEAFGAGRATTFLPPESASGTFTGVTVDVVNAEAGFFTSTSGKAFQFGSGDTYKLGGVASTRADFVARLSSGDSVSGTYVAKTATSASTSSSSSSSSSSSAATPSSFDLTDLSPAAPTVSGGVISPGTTVRLTISRVAAADGYAIYRKVGADAAFSATAYTKIATVPAAASGATTYDDVVPAPNNTAVHYFVTSLAKGQEGPLTATTATSNVDAVLVDGAAAGTPRPVLSSASVSTDLGVVGTLDYGDVVTLASSRPLSALTSGEVLRLEDADATVVDLVNGTNATFVLDPARTQLTATLTGPPTVVTAGAAGGLQRVATVIASSGLVALTDEVQHVAVVGTPGAGTFSMVRGGVSAPVVMPWGAAEVQAALSALTGLSGVTVGGSLVAGFDVTFTGGTVGGTDVAALTTDSSGLTGATIGPVTTTQAGGVAVAPALATPLTITWP